VLLNLLDNAYKYTEGEKYIELRVTRPRDDMVCFSVSDNGIGLSRAAARRVFERFYQVDHTLSRRASGCGLGLSIVKYIVYAHGGEVDVQSQLGQGSVFSVSLPAVRVAVMHPTTTR
jgi:signal transduction histidine kinase